MHRCPTLTNRETFILQYLAERYSNGEIADRLKTTVASVHTHLSNIRKKTKIQDLRDARLCRVYLDTFAVGKRAPGPTDQQAAILKAYYIGRKSSYQIATKLRLSIGTVTNALCQGRKRIPFELARSKEKAREQLLEFFSEDTTKKQFLYPSDPMDDPMF